MSQDHSGHLQDPAPQVPLPVTERNLYYAGKFMTANDFAADTDYLLSRLRLHNRAFHGWGVVHGMTVKHHPNKDQCKNWAVVESGWAIDRLGRELVLTRRQPVRLPLGPSSCGSQQSRDTPFLLCAEFDQRFAEEVPTFYEGAADPDKKQYNRYRDAVKLPTADLNTQDEKLVPLAKIVPRGNGNYDIESVDTPLSRRLTRVTGLNWTHGGESTLEGELRVDFERPLRASEDGARGVNQWTFLAEYSTDPKEARRPVPFLRPPRLDEASRRSAVYEVHPDFVRQLRPGTVIHVTLYCDFLEDERGLAVDGTFLLGRLPSGNGTPGGDFRSWFVASGGRGEGEEQRT
ncbi:hypothetical protein LX15_000856 [Streptoalloteichus tenebrarius]|uniref:Uncharacterized protein n=1 Tax=Streptoalloteichus tenebrarius (strain ATCC 17920 / DSM 40477 / JCM 4838 / CBS 697.72 / NBRC 16177 / NCIMB 11028 / NRRL B-12390 / A12253. 1 / ISP 5477) TaxID=1933 RepID=A0ABT1HNU0_STRSD|nr:hypothetical protein [Streptoalloteichus tenebrarius]MCP2257171.1 hypothetical protein [Streptoalloteichus tenebrarius]BFE98805.1 hypothetical protein GCM10020241_04810 [Streptoalloteichus tenebrarius]